MFFTSLMSYSQVTVFLDIPFFRRRMPSPILLKMFNPSERFGSNQLRGCALCKMINSFPSFYHIIPSFFDIIFAEFVNSRNHHKVLRNYWRGIIFTFIIKLFKDLKKKRLLCKVWKKYYFWIHIHLSKTFELCGANVSHFV